MVKRTEDAADYGDILDKVWGDIPEPSTLPNGSWLLKGRNASYVAPKDDTQNGKVLFFYTPQEPTDDVDAEELAALGEDYDITENQITYTIWIEFGKDWDKVRQHLAKHGVEDSTVSIRDSLKAFKGTQVVAQVGTRTYTDRNGETQVENTASSFTAVE